MKKLIHIFFLWSASLLLVSTSIAQEASTPAKDKQEIISLIKALYKIKPEVYYFAEFPGSGHSVKQHDELASKFFSISLFSRKTATKANPKGMIRLPPQFPNEDDPNNLIAENRNEPLPKIKVEVPELDNQRGKVVVKISDGSLVQLFLQKLPEGWRIYKARTFTHVPKDLYYLIGQENEREAYDGTMREYPDTPEAPRFESSDKPSLKLSPW
jgi:hypothetical protein